MARFRNKKMLVKTPIVKKQPSVDHLTGEKIPKSFVFLRGKFSGSLKQLKLDISASSCFRIPPMGVTHFLILSKPKIVPHLRVARTPQGPALSFEIQEYALAADMARAQTRPRKFVQSHHVPDLRILQDVSDFVTKAGNGSESEAEEESATVSLATDLGRVNRASVKSAVKLQEIGPRMTLRLVKIEEGLWCGGVIFSQYAKDMEENLGSHGEDKHAATEKETVAD